MFSATDGPKENFANMKTNLAYMALVLGIALSACGKTTKKIGGDAASGGGSTPAPAFEGVDKSEATITQDSGSVKKLFNADLKPTDASTTSIDGNWSVIQVLCNGDAVEEKDIPTTFRKLTVNGKAAYFISASREEVKLEPCKSKEECDKSEVSEIIENTISSDKTQPQYLTFTPVRKKSVETVNDVTTPSEVALSDVEKLEQTFSVSVVASTGTMNMTRKGSSVLCKKIKGDGPWDEVIYLRKTK